MKHIKKFNESEQNSNILSINELIKSFIEKERAQLEEKRQYFLTQKGDYSWHNLNSIQGQMGVLKRLEEFLKDK